jgi:hypothetical protein
MSDNQNEEYVEEILEEDETPTDDPFLISERGSGLFNPQLPPPRFG